MHYYAGVFIYIISLLRICLILINIIYHKQFWSNILQQQSIIETGLGQHMQAQIFSAHL